VGTEGSAGREGQGPASPEGPQPDGVWPSPFNDAAGQISDERRIRFADCTLRDGEQQPGVAFGHEARVRVATALDRAGVYEIEAGTPASSPVDAAAIAEICGLGLHAKISVLCRAMAADIDLAMSLGVWGVRISFPISKVSRRHKLKDISDAGYLATALDISRYARDAGAYVIFSPFDTTRADLGFLHELVGTLTAAGVVDRLRLVDTTGCALPSGIANLVRSVRQAAPTLPLEIHCHDDFGLAAANTIAGVVAGADYVSTTVNGIGERSGNASTEETALALSGLYGVDTGIDLAQLTPLSRLVETLSGVVVPPNKAVVGANSFRYESGMVVAGLLREPYTTESYPPELVGQTRDIVIGKTSGRASVMYRAAQLGYQLDDAAGGRILDAAKDRAATRGRALTDDEFRELLATEYSGR
jgi:isopropylmalate/homocitrate/citramalate synthase